MASTRERTRTDDTNTPVPPARRLLGTHRARTEGRLMSAGPRNDVVPNGTQSLLRGNPEAAVRLPAPGETYRVSDLPPEVERVFRRFREHGVIKRITGPGDAGVYRTDPAAYNHARHLEARRTTLPCGHGGVRNLRDAGYTCGEPSCDARFERAVAERALD